MKNVVYSILSGALMFFAFYLIGSFINASFDISTWNEIGRLYLGNLGGFFGFLAFIICVSNKLFENW